MPTFHVSEAEAARDLHALLDKVRDGFEVVAVVCAAMPHPRRLSESIAVAEARGASAAPDAGFMSDVNQGIAERSQPWNPLRSE